MYKNRMTKPPKIVLKGREMGNKKTIVGSISSKYIICVIEIS
jgi:hypothetical protein